MDNFLNNFVEQKITKILWSVINSSLDEQILFIIL